MVKRKPRRKAALAMGEASEHPHSEQEGEQELGLLHHPTRKRGRPRKVAAEEEQEEDGAKIHEMETEEEEEHKKSTTDKIIEVDQLKNHNKEVETSLSKKDDGGQAEKPRRSSGRRKSKPRKSTW